MGGFCVSLEHLLIEFCLLFPSSWPWNLSHCRIPCHQEPCIQYILHACVLSHFSWFQLFVTLWTVARQAPLSIRVSRQEFWSGSPRPPPGDLPKPGIEPPSYVSCIGRGLFTASDTWEAPSLYYLPPKSPWSPREVVFCADFQDFAQTFSIRTCMGGAKESAFLILICIHPPHKNQSLGILIFQNHCLAG